MVVVQLPDFATAGVHHKKLWSSQADFNSFAYTIHGITTYWWESAVCINLVGRGILNHPDQVIDEAHFSAAASYRTIANFSTHRIVHFTGSKFRPIANHYLIFTTP